MAHFRQTMRKFISRWSRQQETALWQMTKGKTMGRRIAGFLKSERIDAKFLLLALVPFVPLIVADEIGWSRGVIWYVWFWLSLAWAVTFVGFGFASYWRAFRRTLGRKQE